MNQAAAVVDEPEVRSRYVVGIDLGTTNSALCYVDTHKQPWHVETFSIAQWVDIGQYERWKRCRRFISNTLPMKLVNCEAHCLGKRRLARSLLERWHAMRGLDPRDVASHRPKAGYHMMV